MSGIQSIAQAIKPWSLSRSRRTFITLSQTCGYTLRAASDRFRDDRNEEESRSQPWKAVWPLTETDLIEIWRESEFSEVISWTFDARCPFDRPWRKWTRSALARSEKRFDGSGEQLFDEEERAISKNAVQREPAGQLDAEIESGNVRMSEFTYLAPLKRYKEEKPYLSRLPVLPGFARTNIAGRSSTIPIHEVSSKENLFTLDKSGFEFANFPILLDEWTDNTIRDTYIPTLNCWLKLYLNCAEVHVYAYNFRGKQKEKRLGEPWKAPFFRAHCDATPASCSKRLKLYLPDREEELKGTRIRFLNIWRSLTFPLQTSPLAMCDVRTVSPEDLVAADIVFPHYLDEAYELLYNSNHRWFYKQGMKADDIIIFKLDDNAKDVAHLCPHSAFRDPSIPEGTPERTSVEVRVIVID